MVVDLDRDRRRHQRLAGHLPAEDSAAATAEHGGIRPPVEIAVDVFKLEERQKSLEALAHAGRRASMFKRT